MKETNIKFIEFGPMLTLYTKRITLEGNELTPKQIQSICRQIGFHYKVAATPNTLDRSQNQILIFQYDSVPPHSLMVDNWTVTPISDNNRLVLDFSLEPHRQLMADLYKRRLQIKLEQDKDFWRLDSPRIFYEKTPIMIESSDNPDIDAYRRFEISDVIINGVGLGFSVDVTTAFFTNLSVDDYLSGGYDDQFRKLSGRQVEQQGTLLYDGPKKKVKCYYVKYHKDLTLATGHSFNLGGKQYSTPYEYFKECHPHFKVNPDDRLAQVSFPGMGGPVEVAANRLYLRVMNNMLPNSMKNLDKILPAEREQILSKRFWDKLGHSPFGQGFRNVQKLYYRPAPDKGGVVPIVNILFGNGAILEAPKSIDSNSYRDHFQKRKKWLNEKGCYFVPPQMERQIMIAYPTEVGEKVIEKYADDLCQRLTKLTDIAVEPVVLPPYDNILDATCQLQNEIETGMVLFVFNNQDPATYYHISRELLGWKLKRATSQELIKKHRDFVNNYKGRGVRNWESYIEQTSYDVIEQLGCVPFIIPPVLNYEMQVVIDVSEKSTHFGLSLMVYNKKTKVPLFQCQIHSKSDPKNKETINKLILEKYMMNLFNSIKHKLEQFKPANLLVLRDGNDCGEEYAAIASVIENLKESNILGQDFYFDFAEYHKTSKKGIRMWEIDTNVIENTLEGSYILLGKYQAVLNPTGGGTLRQGTATPIHLEGKYSPNMDIKKVVEDVFITSQLNYSSPGVAQRLTFAAKRVDNQLIERRAQEVERIK